MSSPPQVQGLDEIFVGESEMAVLMRQHDWDSTSLGNPLGWPNALKMALRLLLTSKFEMWLGWGPDIAFFYNDAYRPTLGNKHPRSLGAPTAQLWSEIWDDVGPLMRRVYERGEATWNSSMLLLIQRHGYLEETYHTFSYSPLIGDSGRVEGLFCTVTEETERIISERRMQLLRELASGLSLTDSRAGVLAAAEQRLAANSHDLPFCLLYLFDPGGHARLGCVTGMDRGHAYAPEEVLPSGHVWNLSRVWDGEGSDLIDLAAASGLPTGAWNQPPSAAVTVPLTGLGSARPFGAMVVGVNPHRAFDGHYLAFVQLLAGQLASSLASAQAYETELLRTAALTEAMKLRTQERDRLTSLFRLAPSFMCLLEGPAHVVGLANEAFLQLVGHRELRGLPLREALPELEAQGYHEILDRVFETGQAYTGRNLGLTLQRQPDRPAELRYVHLIYQPLFDADGEVTGIFVDGADVTDQKLAEDALQRLNETLELRVAERTEALADALDQLKRESQEREAAQTALRQAQKMESLGALTGGIAHDFNNLLQVINGNIQLLGKDIAGNERAEKRAQNALAGVQRGSKLASQLLAFGRRQPLEPKVVNIGRFVRTMDDMLRRALGEEIEIEVVVSAGLWNTLIDPGQIENAILNLAINARDAMDGGGRLTIEASNAMLDDDYVRQHQELQPGQYVLLAVTDTGSGIAPNIVERVFEPFFSTKPEGKGTGLGLSMVYGFVKQSGGHIKIYSEVGEGTTVRLYLPRVFESEDVLADMASLPVRGGNETVLVVEDDEDVRETAAAMLADLGYQVLKARDADSALSVVESGVNIQLLFTDVVMPGKLRSPELARKARERVPGIAVLFTSGYTQNAIVHGGRLDPGVELLSKPYTREQLARKVRHVLGNQAQMALMARRLAERQTRRQTAEAEARAREAVVLLVEDEELIRASVAELIRDAGYSVLEAGTAEQAMSMLSEHPIDVLVADVGLPDLPGTELARRALTQQPGLGLVFATGNASAIAANAWPGAQVIAKPYRDDDLALAIAQLVRRTQE